MTAKKLLLPLLAMAMTSVLSVSCDTTDSSERVILSSEFCTVRNDAGSSKFVFYSDNDVIVNLNYDSDALVRKAFGSDFKRIALIYQYYETDIENVGGQKTISNAVVIDGTMTIDVKNFMTTTDATAQNQLAKDSLFAINTVQAAYVHKGYLTLSVNAPFSIVDSKAIQPDMHVVIDKEDISQDAITMHLLYNRHSKKQGSYNNGLFATSYPVAALKSMVPGKDDITITLKVEGQDAPTTKTWTMKRDDFNLPY